MTLLSDDKAAEWAEHQGLLIDGPTHSTRLGLASASGSMRIQMPDEASELVAIAYMLTMTGVTGYEEGNFAGALLWLQRWEIWSESIDRVGYAMMNGLRGTNGGAQSISEAPAELFTLGEFTRAHACLSLPMLFQWDAHYIPAGGGYLARLSHEGYLDLTARDALAQRALLHRFQQWNPSAVSQPERLVE